MKEEGFITLGIETSCDETSVAVLKDKKILAIKVHSQIDLHKAYGGVVPEIASRDHLEKISLVTEDCIKEAGIDFNEIDLIAYTSHPGLVGSLMSGIMFAKGVSEAVAVPAVEVNHIYAHVFTCGLTHGLDENFLCLLISGGHTAIYSVKDCQNLQQIGTSIDDSIGEVFDKLSKALGFGYPGGVVIEKLAKFGNEDTFKFNIPLRGKSDFDFSMSGIKTEFLKIIQNLMGGVPRGTCEEEVLQVLNGKNGKVSLELSQGVANLCASFQKTVVRIILDRLKNVLKVGHCSNFFVLCGGVASNDYIRTHIDEFCKKNGMIFCVPERELCTDNAGMIAYLGFLQFFYGK